MDKNNDDSSNIYEAERLLNDNWNARKHLVDQEFDLRERTQELVMKRASKAEIDEARRAEHECKGALATNSEEYEALITAWVAAMPSSVN